MRQQLVTALSGRGLIASVHQASANADAGSLVRARARGGDVPADGAPALPGVGANGQQSAGGGGHARHAAGREGEDPPAPELQATRERRERCGGRDGPTLVCYDDAPAQSQMYVRECTTVATPALVLVTGNPPRWSPCRPADAGPRRERPRGGPRGGADATRRAGPGSPGGRRGARDDWLRPRRWRCCRKSRACASGWPRRSRRRRRGRTTRSRRTRGRARGGAAVLATTGRRRRATAAAARRRGRVRPRRRRRRRGAWRSRGRDDDSSVPAVRRGVRVEAACFRCGLPRARPRREAGGGGDEGGGAGGGRDAASPAPARRGNARRRRGGGGGAPRDDRYR